MSRTSLPVLSMRVAVNIFLCEHNYELPEIVALPTNSGLHQLLVADVNVLIGDDIYDEKIEPFRDILCVLGSEQREVVMRTIAIAEMQIRDRLQRRVPACRQKRAITTQANDSDDDDSEKNGDVQRRRALNSMLAKQENDDAEAAASETVMRVLAVAQASSKDSTSAVQVLQLMLKELGDKYSSRFDLLEVGN